MAISRVFFSSRSDEWETPPELFAKLDREFRFTLDPCATKKNAKTGRFFSRKDDGLRQSWGAHRVFMNPPYGGQVGLWMAKAREAASRGALVVCLVYARTDARWWHEHVVGKASEVRFLRGRVAFLRDGRLRNRAPFASAVVIYRPSRGS